MHSFADWFQQQVANLGNAAANHNRLFAAPSGSKP